MKSQNQTLLVILAIIFAVALALTVSIICLAATPTISYDPIPTPNSQQPTPVGSEQPITTPEKSGLLYQERGDGTSILVSVGDCTDACIVIPEYTKSGSRVTSIAKEAFLGCDTVAAIQIPASVVEIGDLAFAKCNNLVYLSVSPQNPAFLDENGVLYSKDRSTLLLYPPMHAGDRLTIPKEVTRIMEMAFYHCAYLSNITYQGSAEQWEAISIAPRNYSLTASAKRFEG